MNYGPLLKFIPNKSHDLVIAILKTHPCRLKVVNQRHTKHGDFKRLANNTYQITVNNNLNLYQFLLTLIHEIAHLVTVKTFGSTVNPHGKEWKQTFAELMQPFLTDQIYPKHILIPLKKHLKNPKASSSTDPALALALRDENSMLGKQFIFELSAGEVFEFRNRTFKMQQKRRTRYECTELNTGKKYLFSQNAEVETKSTIE